VTQGAGKDGAAAHLKKTSEGRAALVEARIAPTLAAMGYDIVRVLLVLGRQARLQVMIERQDGRNITVDDCASASRAIEALLDEDDPVDTAYALEVSSPGIDRPLTRLSDFSRYAGHEAKLELAEAVEGRKRFSGALAGVSEDAVLLDSEGQRVSIPFAALAKAKLVLTDRLIAEHEAAETAPQNEDAR